MKFWAYLGLVTMIFSSSQGITQPIKVKSMRAVEKIVNETLQDIPLEERASALILFDVDGVLIRSSNPAKEIPAIYQYKDVWKKLFHPLTPLEQDLVLTKSIIQDKTILVEDITPVIIQRIIKMGAKVIAFTSFLTGPLGPTLSLEEYRYNDLKQKGFDFSASFPEMGRYEFKTLPQNRGYFPVYYRGILQANGRVIENNGAQQGLVDAKAFILPSFLKYANYHPKVILFIDDSDKHIKAIEEAVKELRPNIKFVGIHYKGAFKVDTPIVTREAFIKTWKEIIDEVKETTLAQTKTPT